jgi:hypothetical protein
VCIECIKAPEAAMARAAYSSAAKRNADQSHLSSSSIHFITQQIFRDSVGLLPFFQAENG